MDLGMVCAAAAAALRRAEESLRVEQAVRGIDTLDERAIQGLLAEGLRACGMGVFREERYPRARALTRRSEGRRCDLVLTPGGLPLIDERAQLDLIGPQRSHLAPRCALDRALWIEVKVVAQFAEGGPNRGYGGALQAPVWGDAERLVDDGGIRHAAQIVVLFTADEMIAAHDLDAWAVLGRRRGLSIGRHIEERIGIVDRLGNAVCTVALFPVECP